MFPQQLCAPALLQDDSYTMKARSPHLVAGVRCQIQCLAQAWVVFFS